MRPLKFRYDIQALRGVAVLSILFYHTKIPFFPAGFLGVDVFFVISGFLITSLIRERIEQDSFSFIEFYFRRAKRLLPAAYVTLLITALLAPFFLASSEMNDFRAQMCGAVTFMSNVVFWRQSGYFEGVAELKPLLHTWSLSIEEQYYFVLPALMFFTPRRRWLHVAILGFVASFVLCMFMVKWKADASFYLLPTRWWGFAIGSIGALIPPLTSERLARLLQVVFWPALLVLLVLPTIKISNFHPGPNALLICVATLLIILRKHPFFFHAAAWRGVVKTGDISYSLYLVHWPLFAFLNNSWLGKTNPPFVIRTGIMFLSFLLAWILNHCIEEPFRKPEIKLTRKLLIFTVASSFLLFLLPIGIIQAVQPKKNYAYLRRANLGFGQECVTEGSFKPISECQNSDQPEILVWGDSFAMHLVPGLLIAEGEGTAIIQATRSVCGPLLGVAPTSVKYGQEWAKKCIEFNESVVSYLAETNSVKTVVISSPFYPYLSRYHWDQDWSLLKKNHSDGSFYLVEPSLIEAIAGIKKTVDAVRSLGKRVVVIAPPPSSNFDVGRCLERLDRGLPVLGAENECQIDAESWKKTNRVALEFLNVLPKQANVEVVYFSDFLCDSISCKTQNENIFIYRDSEHLSYDGSLYLADKIKLMSQIQKLAK